MKNTIILLTLSLLFSCKLSTEKILVYAGPGILEEVNYGLSKFKETA